MQINPEQSTFLEHNMRVLFVPKQLICDWHRNMTNVESENLVPYLSGGL